MLRSRALLTVLLAAISWSLPAAELADNPMPYPPLPEGISSFGATVAGDAIYVFGGRVGRLPGESADGLCPHFVRLNLKSEKPVWEELPMEQTSQSPGLVAWDGQVYRVGGLSFKNRAGEPTDFNSLATFAKFDPSTNTWTALPELPTPRSSLDAAVVDGRLYVVGGWNLQGASSMDAAWHEDTLAFDLTKPDSQWTTIAKPPFQTRALAAAAHDHKLYVLGGMKSDNQTTTDVHIYDPATDSWSTGPELLSSGNFGGFAISAFATGGKLYYCGGDGSVYALNAAGDGWQAVERLLFSRMFHRVVPVADDKLAVLAGVASGGYLGSVELVSVSEPRPDRIKAAEWSVPFEGTVKSGQGLLIQGPSLYALGGTNSRKAHDFAKEAFVAEAYRFDIAQRTVEKLENLPQAVQGGVPFVAGSRIDPSIYLIGGLSCPGEKFSSSDLIQQYRLRSKSWTEDVQHLPASRAMFNVASHRGTAWIFGGSQVNDGSSGLAEETWQWDPLADAPAAVVPNAGIPTPRRSFAGTLFQNQYYAVGGLADKMGIVGPGQVFDFEKREWTEFPAPQHHRVFGQLAAAGGKLYLSGGFSRVDGHFAGTTTIEVYDPATKTWGTAFQELAPKLAEMTMLEYQDRLLFYSIDKDQDGLAHFVLLDPAPQTVGYGAQPAPTEERTGPSDLVTRLLKLDKNKDGKVTRDEVGPRFLPVLERIDADKDGAVTQAEIEDYEKQQQASQGGSGRPGPGGPGGGGPRGGGRGRGERPAGGAEPARP